MGYGGVGRYSTALWLLVPALFLGGCVRHHPQTEAAARPDSFRLQALVGRTYVAERPLTIHRALRAEHLPPHGLPLHLSAAASWDKPSPRQAYAVLAVLPAGTHLELVGESVLHRSAINPTTFRYGYFIVHDVPVAHELLLPVAAEDVLRAVHGVRATHRPAPPWLRPVMVPSQWRRARYRDIAAAPWHRDVALDLDVRVMPPP